MITFDDVHAFYGKKEVLHGVSFELEENKITSVLGRNGSGKSTLVSCLTNGVRCSGKIMLDGENILKMPLRDRAKRISVLPQILLSVGLTVEQLTSMGRTPYLDIGRHMTDFDRQKVREAMEAVGIYSLKDNPVNKLSGGEKQKAYLAMTLAQDTDITVLDEPTTYMDAENQADFIELVKSLKNRYGKTVMIVLHDLTKAVEISDNILIIEDGKKAFFGSADDCVESGRIEKCFNVKKSFFEKDALKIPVYYA